MDKHFKTMIALVLLVALNVWAGDKADFSGNWAMDQKRTQGLSPSVHEVMTVSEDGDTVNVETTVSSDRGDRTVSVSYVLDDSIVDYTGVRDGVEGKGKRRARWSPGGNGFEVSEEEIYQSDKGLIVVGFNKRWTMGAGGTTLTIATNIRNPNGTSNVSRTFVKQQ